MSDNESMDELCSAIKMITFIIFIALQSSFKVYRRNHWQPNRAESKCCQKDENEWRKSYFGYRTKNFKSTKEIIHDAPKEPKNMGPSCSSILCGKWKTQICSRIIEEERNGLLNQFWKTMNWDVKKMFVCSCVESSKSQTENYGCTILSISYLRLPS